MLTQFYAFVADVIAILHGVIAIYLISASFLIFVLKKELPNWYHSPMSIMILIALPSYCFIQDCPINPVENYFRKLAGQDVYQSSFLAHYLQELLNIELSKFSVYTIDITTGIIVGALFIWVLAKKFPKR